MKNIKRLSLLCLILLILTGTLFTASAAAEEAPVIEIERVLPEKLKGGKEAQITLNVKSGDEFMLGIVETLPEGWSFPEDDAAVSDCPAFRLDRENRKISFAADNISQIHYTVIPAKDSSGEITGEYVDMLYRSQELDQGRNMWKLIGGGAQTEDVQTSAAADNLDRSNTTVWVIVLVAVVVLVLLLGKKFIGKGPKNEK